MIKHYIQRYKNVDSVLKFILFNEKKYSFINKQYGEFHGGITSMHIATSNGDTEILDVLADEDTINVTDDYGLSPLHLSVLMGHAQIGRILTGEGADKNSKDFDGYTPFGLFCKRMINEECIEDEKCESTTKSCQDHLSKMKSPSETSEHMSEDLVHIVNIEQDHAFA